MANKMLLDNYVQSYGVEIPKDWTFHQVGHQYESECVLCNAKHDFIELFRYDPDNRHLRKGTGTYVCEDCQASIENSLLRYEYPDFSADESLVEIGYLGEVAVEVRNRRIEEVNNHYEFDNSVKLRYTYLRCSKDVYVKPGDINKCYFCEVDITVSNVTKLKVPVQHCEEISGGVIKCCPDCAALLDKDLLSSDLQAIKENHKARCGSCQNYYWISAEEAAFRNISRNPHRVCPECAYETIDRIVTLNNLYYLRDNLRPRENPMRRFKQCRCDYCMNDFTLDLTVLMESNLKHVIDTRIACLDCKILYPKYLVAGTYVYKHSKNVWAIIHSTQGKWAYTIVKLFPATKNVVELITTAEENVIDSLPEAVSLASEECYNIVEGKQFALWEDI